MRDWMQQLRITVARLKIEHPTLVPSPLFPRFQATFLLLWVVSIVGLLVGRFFDHAPSAHTLSMLLTAASWLTSVFILLIHDPLPRATLLLGQIITLIFALLLVPVGFVAYSIFILSGNIVLTIKLAWLVGALLLAYVTVQLFVRTFVLPLFSRRRYPGMFSCPVLFVLLVINYIWWNWASFVSWFR